MVAVAHLTRETPDKDGGDIAVPEPFDHDSVATHSTSAGRFGPLVAEVANWAMLQQTRIKVQLPAKAVERQGAEPPAWLTTAVAILAGEEKEAKKRIAREWRSHPLAPWAETVRGLGGHSCAVIVALLNGDPYIAYPKRWAGGKVSGYWVEDSPYARMVSQLWAYCGHGAPSRRAKGMDQDDAMAMGKPLLKSRVHLVAEDFLKQSNETYRAVYDEAKAVGLSREWTLGHAHNHALRLVAKRFLVDLWLESKRLHEGGEL